MLAYDSSLLGLFWAMLILFLWVAWIILVVRVVFDIFRSDMSGVAKALWMIFVVLIPWLGVLIYVIANGNDMAGREIKRQQDAQEEFASYVRQTAGSGSGSSAADELSKLAALRDSGALTDEEFAAQKAKLLA